MTKQQFIRKGLYLGHDKSVISEVADQIEHAGGRYEDFLPSIEIGIPSIKDSSENRFCPVCAKNMTAVDCHKMIEGLSWSKRQCAACDHSEWF